MSVRWIAAGAALFVSSAVVTARQAPATIFTAPQADGRNVYGRICASCHMPDLSGSNDTPPLAGSVFLGTWRARTTRDLFEYLSASMPPGGASLSTESFASITAYILEANGASAGSTPFRASTAIAIGDLIAR